MMRPVFTFRPIVLATLMLATVSLVAAAPAAAETIKIPDSGGGHIEVEVSLPANFNPTQTYSVMVSPGDFYWGDGPPQPGWIVIASDAFYERDRLKDAPRVLAWARRTYKVRGGGFHIAGWSRNSAGVFQIAMAYPTDFLSVTGIAGMPSAGSESDIDKLSGVRVQFIVGEKDGYWRRGSEKWFGLMQSKGIEATLEIIPGGEHVMPELKNKPIFDRMDRLVEELERGD